MKRVLAYGGGSCLFICLRLALEYIKLLSVYDQGDPTKIASKGIIDGRDEDVLKSAEELRNNYIIKWYDDHLDEIIPVFGTYDENSKSAWKRSDIIANEIMNLKILVDVEGTVLWRNGEDIPDKATPENANKRLKLIKAYLNMMSSKSGRRAWGGQPEYTAFAFMTKLTVQVWVEQRGGLVLRNEIVPPGSTNVVKLLFSGQCHYDLLMDDADAEKILKMLPKAKII